MAFVPEQDRDVPRTATLDLILNRASEWFLSRAAYDTRQARARALFDRLADDGYEFSLIDAGEAMCNVSECPAIFDGLPVYYDQDHVTVSTAKRLSFLFEPAF